LGESNRLETVKPQYRGLKRDAGPGRPKGSKSKVPSVMRLCADLILKEPTLIVDAFRRGLTAKPPVSFPYLKLMTDHWDGQPAPTLPEGPAAVSFTLHLSQGSPPALTTGPIIDVTHDDSYRGNGHPTA
jgi:hypothetical protein